MRLRPVVVVLLLLAVSLKQCLTQQGELSIQIFRAWPDLPLHSPPPPLTTPSLLPLPLPTPPLPLPLSFTLSDDTCRYRYTRQPPTSLDCDPYPTGRLITSCEVRFGPQDESVTLQWVFRSLAIGTTSILSTTGTKYIITPRSSTSLVSSQLRVESLSDSDAGDYVCQVQFRNGSLANPSQELRLFSSEIFDSLRISPCSQFSPQDVSEERCALTATSVAFTPSSSSAIPQPTQPGGGSGVNRDVIVWSIVGGLAGFIVLLVLLAIGACLCIAWINANTGV